LEQVFEHLPSAAVTLVDRFDVGGGTYVLLRERRQRATRLRMLTATEHAVLELLVQGNSTKEAAFALGITAGTVRVLIMRAARRCGVAGREALLVLARRDQEARGPSYSTADAILQSGWLPATFGDPVRRADADRSTSMPESGGAETDVTATAKPRSRTPPRGNPTLGPE
jgi:DNA-binding CsgD family transcriptional regulator